MIPMVRVHLWAISSLVISVSLISCSTGPNIPNGRNILDDNSGSGGARNPIDAIQLKEITTSGELFTLPAERSVTSVDLNSTVKVIVNPAKLGINSLRAETHVRDIASQREQIIYLLKLTNDYIVIQQEIGKAFLSTHTSAGKRIEGVEDADIKALKTKQKERNDTAKNILKTARKYLIASRNVDADGADTILSAEMGGGLSDRKFYAFLEREAQTTVGITTEEIRRVTSEMMGDEFGLRLKARLISPRQGSVPIHLPGYDTYDAGEPKLLPHIIRNLDKETMDDLQKQVTFATQTVGIYNELASSQSGLRRSMRDILSAIRNDIDNLGQTLEDQSPEFLKAAEKLISGLSQAAAANSASAVKFNLLRVRLEHLAVKVRETIVSARSLRSMIPADTANLGPDFPIRFATKLDQVQVLIDNIKALVDEKSPESVAKVLALADEIIADPTLKKSIERAEPGWEQLVKDFGKGIFPSAMKSIITHQDDLSALTSFVGQLKSELATQPLAQTPMDPSRIKFVSISAVQDTEIALPRTARRENDLVELTAQVVRNDLDKTVVNESSKLLEVEKFGLYSNLSGGAIFVKRLSNPSSDRAVNFQASPAVSYLFHYRERQAASFWNALNPGFGFNVSALNFEGSKVEVGVGGVVTLFNDILQVGYGYNLQVDQKHQFIFLGIGLSDLLGSLKDMKLKSP